MTISIELGLVAGACAVGLALAAALLVACLELRRRVARAEARTDALTAGLERAAAGIERGVEAERRMREQLTRLVDRLGQIEMRADARGYERAIELAAHGEGAEHLVSRLGLSEAEASLVDLVHGRGVPRAANDRDRSLG